jgi:cellulose synthase/poly-beta-1,6-N-acetylglucosamine synthase-like glycosyltransferase
MRQRTRWYQGHLQCWSRIADLLRCRELSAGRQVDLIVYLVAPITVLLITLSLAAFLPRLAVLLSTQQDAAVHALLAHNGLLLWWYLFVLGLAPLIGYIYWRACNRTTRDVRLPKAMLYALLFSVYAYLWLPVGWRATARLLRGERRWAKTLRLPAQSPGTATTEPAGPR